LSTFYHLNRFFIQNAEFDKFEPQRHTLEWARQEKLLRNPDLWLLSELQGTVQSYTAKLEASEFNVALAMLENFVIESLSRLYVPLVRKELWTDDPETLGRRLAVYTTLWHSLRTTALLFNPVTPYLSETLHQKVYRKLNPTLPQSVNFEDWPSPDEKLRDTILEESFQTLFKTVSLVYSARQEARLKRRWPLRRMVVVTPGEVSATLGSIEHLFLELTNVKTVKYSLETPEYVNTEDWTAASDGDIQVFLDIHRDENLLGEGLMRDLARRVQALRKEIGYAPTDVLKTVNISGLEDESVRLLQPFLHEMKDLVRAKNVRLFKNRLEVKVDWHDSQLDRKKVYIAICESEDD